MPSSCQWEISICSPDLKEASYLFIDKNKYGHRQGHIVTSEYTQSMDDMQKAINRNGSLLSNNF